MAALLVEAGSASQAEPAPNDFYTSGVTALDQGLPQVAACRLRAFLRTTSDPAARREATFALAQALLDGPEPAAALDTLDGAYPLPPTAADLEDGTLDFWRGQSLAAVGRWPEALDHYTRAARTPGLSSLLQAQASFGRGEALLALSANGDSRFQTEAAAAFKTLCEHPQLGPLARLRSAEIALDGHHLKDAARVLVDALPGGRPESLPGHALAKEYAYLVGRLRLAQHQPALAQQIFQSALTPSNGLSSRLLVDLYWGQARAFLDEDQPDRAQSELEKLLESDRYRFPREPYLPTIFSWLESLYSRLPNPDLTDLQRWSDDPDAADHARAALAHLTLAHLEAHAGRPERAEALLDGFGPEFPDDPLRVRAFLDLAALRLRLGRPREARETLARAREVAGGDARWRTGLEAVAAQLDLAENEDLRAAGRFETLADRLGSGTGAEAAAFNAALASLRSGNTARFAGARAEFTQRFPRSALAAEFALEEGLIRAANVSPSDPAGRLEAVASLRRFLRDHPTHPRATEARLALAELSFLQPTPDLSTVREELAAPEWQRISNGAPEDGASAAARDRADYLAIWVADAPGPKHDDEQAVTLAKKFLETRTDSPLAAEVRLKLGEIYFARGDYPDAQTQLALVGENPGSPLADAALYLAGRAAASSRSSATGLDQAVEFFNQVLKHPGPFRLPARLRLAEVMLDKAGATGAQDALILYDNVLTATGGPGPLSGPDLDARCTALCGRGQALLALAAKDLAFYPKATETFDQLATGTPGASLRWRRQALTLKGKVFEKTGDTEGALAAYDDALNATDPGPGGGDSATEWKWFYRAGREAATLLEKQSQWAAAIAIYKKLASADGPMKSEFETLLARQRLEHFIWED